jgi:hypothetical protein
VAEAAFLRQDKPLDEYGRAMFAVAHSMIRAKLDQLGRENLKDLDAVDDRLERRCLDHEPEALGYPVADDFELRLNAGCAVSLRQARADRAQAPGCIANAGCCAIEAELLTSFVVSPIC